MSLPEVRMSFADRAALERELDQNIKHGRAFLNQTSEVPVLSECVLVLVHPDHGRELRLSAQVVMVNPSGPMCGMGIALRSFGPTDVQRVQQFAASGEAANDTCASDLAPVRVSSAAPSRPAAASTGTSGVYAADGGERPGSQRPRSIAPDFPPELARKLTPIPAAGALPEPAAVEPLQEAPRDTAADGPSQAQPAESALDPEPLGDAELSQLAEESDGLEEQELALDEEAAEARRQIELQVGNKQEKLRNLNAAQQLKLARSGELAERIALERLYGKQVWEALLHNPRLSLPEVARIARKGTVPKPLLEVILENNAWLKADPVRRALLSNPKIGADAIVKLLRLTPKHELKLIEKSTAYGVPVREAARKLLKQ